MVKPYFNQTSSYTAAQLRWAVNERAECLKHSWTNLFEIWDDEARYIAGLLIAGGNYDDTSEVE
jgi:hypothetical protein